MAATGTVRVEVVYACANRQHLIALEVPAGTTISALLDRCRKQRLLPEAAFRRPDFGVFGRKAAGDRVLEPGDRVEIYRPLKVDPKEARRRRARAQRNRTRR